MSSVLFRYHLGIGSSVKSEWTLPSLLSPRGFFSGSVAAKGTVKTKEFSTHVPLEPLLQASSLVCEIVQSAPPRRRCPEMRASGLSEFLAGLAKSREKSGVGLVLQRTSFSRSSLTPFPRAGHDGGSRSFEVWGMENRSLHCPEAARESVPFALALAMESSGVSGTSCGMPGVCAVPGGGTSGAALTVAPGAGPSHS